MDAPTLTKLVKELKELTDGENATKKAEEAKAILTRFKTEVVPTEDLLRSSKAGVAVGKLRTNADAGVAALSKEIVKLWKDKIEENKKKRKREDGEGSGVKKEEEGKDKDIKRVKAEASASASSPAGSSGSAGSDSKPKLEDVKPKTEDNDVKAQSPATRPPLSTIDSDRKESRTAKKDGIADKLRAEPNDGDDFRHKIVVQFYDALASDSTAEKKILTERAQGIERQVWEKANGSTGNDYRQKCRSLFLNLKDKQNPWLRNEIVLGSTSPEKFVEMTKEELASETVRAMNEKIAMENLFKAKAVGETQAETDAFKCGRCQQRKCTYYQMQTRSADEPMTTFVSCTNCGNKWKFS